MGVFFKDEFQWIMRDEYTVSDIVSSFSPYKMMIAAKYMSAAKLKGYKIVYDGAVINVDKLKSLVPDFSKGFNIVPIEKKVKQSNKEKFHSKNDGSICCWMAVNEKLKPNREPDLVTYSGRVFVVWDYELDITFGEEDEDGNVWGFDEDGFGGYLLLDTFEGREGDTGYKIRKVSGVSNYWHEKHGVYRESDHWGKVGKSDWNVSDGCSKLGYANYSDFKFKR